MKAIRFFTPLLSVLLLASCGFENFDERCEREAQEYTQKQCPRRMDQYTMMDSLTYNKPTRTLTYYYTLEGVLDNDSVMTPDAGNILEANLKEAIINSVDLKTHKDKGINFCYCYHSKTTGKVRFTTTITQADYSK